MKPCVVVVTGSVVGCGRRNPEPRNRSYKGPRQLSQSKECMARVVYVVCMCVLREVLGGVGGSVLKCCL